MGGDNIPNKPTLYSSTDLVNFNEVTNFTKTVSASTGSYLIFNNRLYMSNVRLVSGSSWLGSVYLLNNNGTTWDLVADNIPHTIVDTGEHDTRKMPMTEYAGRIYVGTGNAGKVYVSSSLDSGDLISKPNQLSLFDKLTLNWSAIKPVGTDIKFQVRYASSEAGLNSASFVGPDNTTSSYFTTSGTSVSNFPNSAYMQYRVLLNSVNSKLTPYLEEITVNSDLESISTVSDIPTQIPIPNSIPPSSQAPVITIPSDSKEATNLKNDLNLEGISKDVPISITTNDTNKDPKKDPLQNKDIKITPNVFKDKGGVVISSDGKASIAFDKGTALIDLYVTINNQESGNKNIKANYNDFKDHNKLSDIYQIKAYDLNKKEVTNNLTASSKFVQLSLKYNSSSEVKKGKESLYYYDIKNKSWIISGLRDPKVNSAKMLIIAKTNHLTDYAIFGENLTIADKLASDKNKILIFIFAIIVFIGIFIFILLWNKKIKIRKEQELNNIG